ncbi:hypothetical protein CIPAW_16G047100 [Carya illinoinensis]|uniref:No apical meristem-associated C-terminal domain-containing protein n=1 Tax=Carya illinoinensis TaxID=32201 RepID=A0A8T1N3G5_CARIL|nr:hypothetical protein CIPAW_16G047100 [Carya illinoinensis]
MLIQVSEQVHAKSSFRSSSCQTIKSLIHPWSVIQKATNKFCAKLAQVEGLNQSGMTDQDKFDKAKVMYQALEKCSFQFEHCWHLLKDQPKMKTMSPSLTPTQCSGTTIDSAFDIEGDNVMENEVIELDRPIGRKAEKGKRKAQGRGKFPTQEDEAENLEYDKEKEEKKLRHEDERLRLEAEKMVIEREKELNKICQEDERLRLEAQKVELALKDQDQRIMMMDVSAMPEMQRLYFQQLQREIMARRNTSKD